MDKVVLDKGLDILKRHGVEMAKELAVELLFPFIEEKVKESGNKIDDVVWAAIKDDAKKYIEELKL